MALSIQDIRALRLAALRLAPEAGAQEQPLAAELPDGGSPSSLTPVTREATGESTARIRALGDSMLAMQGQDVGAVLWAIGLRTGATLDQVKTAFNDAVLIRSWPMRGTVHALRGEDIGWIQQFTTPRLAGASAQRRREHLQLDLKIVEKTREIALEVLVNNPLSRDDFFDEVAARGISIQGPWRYHIVWYLAQTGTLALGPFLPEKTEQALVLLDEWVPRPRALVGDEALAELVTRYLGGHGPATIKDLMWWVGLPARDIKRGVNAAGEMVVDVTGPQDTQYLLAANQLAKFEEMTAEQKTPTAMTSGKPDVHLLPAFDEHLLGYSDRFAHLNPDHFAALVPGRNGVFKPTVVVDGVALGTWARLKPTARTGHVARVTVTPFDQVTAQMMTDSLVWEGIGAAAARYGSFLGRDESEVTLV